jgi:hypothetical protein
VPFSDCEFSDAEWYVQDEEFGSPFRFPSSSSSLFQKPTVATEHRLDGTFEISWYLKGFNELKAWYLDE